MEYNELSKPTYIALHISTYVPLQNGFGKSLPSHNEVQLLYLQHNAMHYQHVCA